MTTITVIDHGMSLSVLSMLPVKCCFIWPNGFRDFWKLTNQKQELPVTAMFDNRSGRNNQSL
jgi:hypothetical protein